MINELARRLVRLGFDRLATKSDEEAWERYAREDLDLDIEALLREPGAPPNETEDAKVERWCVEMLKRGMGKDMIDVKYVRGCARREADEVRERRPDLAAKFDAVVAKITARGVPE